MSRPRRPPPPIPAAHTRSPSASSVSSSSSLHSNPRTVNPGFTVFPNSSTSTIKLIGPGFDSPKTPTQRAPSYSSHTPSPVPQQSSKPGFFDSSLMNSQSPDYAARKRSATDPATASPVMASSLSTSASFSNEPSIHYYQQQSQQTAPIPIPPMPSIMHQQLSAPSSAPSTKKESSKMKIFSKPSRIGTPGFASSMGIDKTLRPPLSPSKLPSRTSLDSRKPSFSTDHPPGYSESPPSTSSKSHSFLSRSSRKDKEKAAASALPPPPPLPAELTSSSSTHKTSFDLPSYSSAAAALHLPGSPGAADGKHPSSSGSASINASSTTLLPGVTTESTDDPFPYIRSQILPLFSAALMDAPIEHLNAACRIWIRRYIERRNPVGLLTEFREVLEMGMRSIDPSLIVTATEDDLVTRLVDIWGEVFSFTTPYLEAVFLPLQMEFKGCGPLLASRDTREFWGLLDHSSAPTNNDADAIHAAALHLDIRRLVLLAFRDSVILPLVDKLRIVFSRLRMDFSVSQRQATEVQARMLQCVSVLVGCQTGDTKQKEMEALAGILKLNWLGRGRTGRNRKGFVGVRMARGEVGV